MYRNTLNIFIRGYTKLIIAPVEYLNSFENNRQNFDSFADSIVFYMVKNAKNFAYISLLYLHNFTFSMLINTSTSSQKTAKKY